MYTIIKHCKSVNRQYCKPTGSIHFFFRIIFSNNCYSAYKTRHMPQKGRRHILFCCSENFSRRKRPQRPLSTVASDGFRPVAYFISCVPNPSDIKASVSWLAVCSALLLCWEFSGKKSLQQITFQMSLVPNHKSCINIMWHFANIGSLTANIYIYEWRKNFQTQQSYYLPFYPAQYL